MIIDVSTERKAVESAALLLNKLVELYVQQLDGLYQGQQDVATFKQFEYEYLMALRMIWGRVERFVAGRQRITTPMTSFEESYKRDQDIILKAKLFTVVCFRGVGNFERHEEPTLERAKAKAKEMGDATQSRYMIYAVSDDENTAFAGGYDGERGVFTNPDVPKRVKREGSEYQ